MPAMDVQPVTLAGAHVRLEPMRREHIDAMGRMQALASD
jgi:hypothetical protein